LKGVDTGCMRKKLLVNLMVYSSLLLENVQANMIRKYFGIVVAEHVNLENHCDLTKFNP
jgi:hypothetical protein